MTIIKEKPPTIETNRLLEYWNQEIITEAAKAALKKMEKIGFRFVTAIHDANNPGRGRIVQKLGMGHQYPYQEQWRRKILKWPFGSIAWTLRRMSAVNPGSKTAGRDGTYHFAKNNLIRECSMKLEELKLTTGKTKGDLYALCQNYSRISTLRMICFLLMVIGVIYGIAQKAYGDIWQAVFSWPCLSP